MEFERLLKFLNQLKDNNNRDWFNENKKEFVELKKQFEVYIDQLIPKVKQLDGFNGSLSAKDCIFRIYRDVRFSKNKDPYKTHFGAYLANDGRKSRFAGYYIHIEPNGSFAGGGVYHPEASVLKELRYEIMDRTDEFKKIISVPGFKKVFPEIYGDKLKTAPSLFFNMVKDNSDFSMQIMKLSLKELGEANKFIIDIAQKTVRERLAEVLILLKDTFLLDNEKYLQVSLTREELANLVGTATESVIRLLSEFKSDKYIELNGRRIKILNIDALKKLGGIN